MNSSEIDWPRILTRAAQLPEEAFEFVREGMKHTLQQRCRLDGSETGAAVEPAAGRRGRTEQQITGRELCKGLRDLATQRWGVLAPTVLRRWGIEGTEDFGTIVYALIDRGELRAGPDDSIEDFKGVYDFAEAFASGVFRN